MRPFIASLLTFALLLPLSAAQTTRNTPISVTGEPPVVWVDDDFAPGMLGWGILRFNTIQEGANAVAPGGTVFVGPGTYRERVVIHKSLNLRGQSPGNTTIDAEQRGTAIYVDADAVRVSGLTIRNAGDPYDGNEDAGVLVLSRDCIFEANSFTNNEFGIILGRERGNSVLNNEFIHCGVVIFGSVPSEFAYQIIEGNTVNGKPLRYIVGAQDIDVPLDTGQLILVACSNVRVTGLALAYNDISIQVAFCTNIQMLGCQISTGLVYFMQSHGSSVTNSTIEYSGDGLILELCTGITVDGCTLHHNSDLALFVRACTDCVFSNNLVQANATGMSIEDFSFNNLITGNQIMLNDIGSIMEWDSSFNTFTQNNYIDNIVVNAYDPYVNAYDLGACGTGNYWSDYPGRDQDGDGCGDTPYSVPDNNFDDYPRMTPYPFP